MKSKIRIVTLVVFAAALSICQTKTSAAQVVNKNLTNKAVTILPASLQTHASPRKNKSRINATVLPTIIVEEKPINLDVGYQAVTTNIGKMLQEPHHIPQSLTSVTSSLIVDRNADTLKEALRNIGGLSYNSLESGANGRTGDNVTIRGYGASQDFYLDGVRDDSQYNRDTFNLEKVEILKGSSSMLFGRGSVGGLVNLVSKEADLNLESNVKSIVGSNSYFRETADVSRNIGKNSAFRINFMKTDADSYRDSVTRNSFGIAPSLKFEIGTDNEYLINYSHLQYSNTPDYGAPIVRRTDGAKPVDVTRNTFYGFNSDHQKDKIDTLTASWTHKFDKDQSIKTIVRNSMVDRDFQGTRPDYSPTTNYITQEAQGRGAKERYLSLQSNYNAKFKTSLIKHEALLGAEILHEKSSRWFYANPNSNPRTSITDPNSDLPAPSLTRVNPVKFRNSDLGIYAQDIIELAPKWKLLVGARHDNFNTNYEGTSELTTEVTTNTFKTNSRVWSYRGSLMFQPTRNSNYYVSRATSFTPQGNVSSGSVTQTANGSSEKSITSEVGAKWSLLQNQLSLRTALFRTEKVNETQIDVQDLTTPFSLSRTSHVDGIEFESTGKITKRWEIFANVSFLKGRVEKNTNPYAEGLNTTNTPWASGNIWNSFKLTENWRIAGGVDFVGSRQGYQVSTLTPYTQPTVTSIAGYARVDAMTSWENKNYILKLNLFNLLNKQYYESIHTFGNQAMPGLGRSAQFTLGYKF